VLLSPAAALGPRAPSRHLFFFCEIVPGRDLGLCHVELHDADPRNFDLPHDYGYVRAWSVSALTPT